MPFVIFLANLLQFFFSIIFALTCRLNKYTNTSLGLVKEEKVRSTTDQDSRTDDDGAEIDEQKGGLNY